MANPIIIIVSSYSVRFSFFSIRWPFTLFNYHHSFIDFLHLPVLYQLTISHSLPVQLRYGGIQILPLRSFFCSSGRFCSALLHCDVASYSTFVEEQDLVLLSVYNRMFM